LDSYNVLTDTCDRVNGLAYGAGATGDAVEVCSVNVAFAGVGFASGEGGCSSRAEEAGHCLTVEYVRSSAALAHRTSERGRCHP